ncbi:MAG TPA: type II secretion system F family protein [Baekduia sp.]|uniref:type II secretion system F family protein n=1 Tax=Baekduia sp. TaxID=2600305 RepID=UPI002BF6884B|nr:type II secretion system F family protein [Baekduia sp.]HMJ32745.1 type II secretion system F family protein [Baekduia sp.]
MRRACLIAAAATVLGGGLAGPVHAAGPAPRLAQAAGSRFPDRAFALTLPTPKVLVPGQVEVRENGRRIAEVTVASAQGSAARRFGVVLAIDTSTSMRGRPLRGAVQAARRFVARRQPQQPVALVTFAGTIRVALPFTTDPVAIDRALSAIAISGGGSKVLDAAARSVALIRASHAASGSVVLLSDGGDRGSTIPMDAVVAAAKADNARIFAIGLRGAKPDFGALNLLAAGSGAEFSSAASPHDLARVFGRLGSQLANQYLVQYRSPAGPREGVQVEVRVRGLPGAGRAAYRTPATVVVPGLPFHHSPGQALWLSPATVLVVAMVLALLAVATLRLLLRPAGRPLRDRMSAYVQEAAPEGTADVPAPGPRRRRTSAERLLEQLQWWTRFKEDVDVGGLTVAPERLVAYGGIATVVLFGLLLAAGGSPVMALPALLVPVAVHRFVAYRARKRREAFTAQLPDNLQMVASAMRAGHSFAGALAAVVDDAPEPSRDELRRVVADERLGTPLDEALGLVVARMSSRDLEQVALVAALQRETGGNTAEVLERVIETVRERVALRRNIQTLTAQGRMSRWVLTAIPIVLLAAITAINPAYVSPLYHTSLGHLMLGVATAMVIAGSMVIKNIVNIKV